LKYYEAQKGTITIDGVDFNQISADWFREKIGFVGQEPILFNGTIRDNLRVGKPNATD
jgi:ABC-type multidrug transport system fused ATPase/permease subunit